MKQELVKKIETLLNDKSIEKNQSGKHTPRESLTPRVANQALVGIRDFRRVGSMVAKRVSAIQRLNNDSRASSDYPNRT